MADLNDLKKFEEDMKKLIRDREEQDRQMRRGFSGQPEKKSQIYDDDSNLTYMAVPEHGRPFFSSGRQPLISKMAVKEHGRPFESSRKPYMSSGTEYIAESAQYMPPTDYISKDTDTDTDTDTIQYIMISHMAVPEHGRPFESFSSPSMASDTMITRMAVREHGRPFESFASPSMASDTMVTRMAVREHGRPFTNPFAKTDMAIPEHGRPYNKSSSKPYMQTSAPYMDDDTN